MKNIVVRGHCRYTGEYRGTAHSIYNLKNSLPKKVPIVFHNESNCDYHFIIKGLEEEFKQKFNYLGENTEKYINFSVPIGKEVTRIDKNGEEIARTIFYRLQFIGNARFMESSLSILAIILVKEFIKLNVQPVTYCFLNTQALKMI